MYDSRLRERTAPLKCFILNIIKFLRQSRIGRKRAFHIRTHMGNSKIYSFREPGVVIYRGESWFSFSDQTLRPVRPCLPTPNNKETPVEPSSEFPPTITFLTFTVTFNYWKWIILQILIMVWSSFLTWLRRSSLWYGVVCRQFLLSYEFLHFRAGGCVRIARQWIVCCFW